MALFKCKMCGGSLEVQPGESVAVCDSCGTKQTLPKTNDEVIANLFNRANNLRLKCEFDKAEQIYEKIVQQDDSEAEAHWGIVLCKYGIEYVEDPKTFKRIPTCHRTLFDSITTDPDYLAAVDYSDAYQQDIYKAEARAIDRIQKDILSIVKNEKPFDVFICYKEADENGKRTIDSTIANDIYYQLTQEGFKVFYAAITLEDKLGQEYEPYIFAALNSAKVMLVIGTKPEYFDAVWVKNEWSRYLKLMKTDRSKLLVPCFRDMDAYDLPEEFSHLQAQDMSKIGFIQDIVRGIKKVCSSRGQTPKNADAPIPTVNAGVNTAPLLERAFMFLEDGDWQKADDFCEQVLNQEPKNAEAYLGKLMAELHIRKQDDLKDCEEPFDNYNNYQKALRFADPLLADTLSGYIDSIKKRKEQERLEAESREAAKQAEASRLKEERKKANDAAKQKLKKYLKIALPVIAGYVVLALVTINFIIPNIKYNAAVSMMNEGKYNEAITAFEAMDGYKDSENQLENCYIGKYGEEKWNKIKNIKVGDTYTFGAYEQDNSTSNGKEAIEWTVLDKDGMSLLLISKQALDCQQYNTSNTDVTWASCSLRKWMNGTFLNNAFNAEEQAQIQNTTVSADKNPKYNTNPGNATTDKVFLLSINEVEKYFNSDEARKCAPTAYAKAQGTWTSDSHKTASGEATCWWWLRSPGFYQNLAAYVYIDGSVFYYGDFVNYVNYAVRPAMWINLNS